MTHAGKALLTWSREWELNPRPTVYETVALPLSYLGQSTVESLLCHLTYIGKLQPRVLLYTELHFDKVKMQAAFAEQKVFTPAF